MTYFHPAKRKQNPPNQKSKSKIKPHPSPSPYSMTRSHTYLHTYPSRLANTLKHRASARDLKKLMYDSYY